MTESVKAASIVLPGITFTMNQALRMHHMAVSRHTAGIRKLAARKWAEVLEGRPLETPVKVIVGMVLIEGRVPQDIGACMPAAKAAIDGLVDAGGIPDDHSGLLQELTFISHTWKKDRPTEMIVQAVTIEGKTMSEVETREATLAEELELTRKGKENADRKVKALEERIVLAIDHSVKLKTEVDNLSSDLLESQDYAIREAKRAERAEAGWAEAEKWHLDRLELTPKSSVVLYFKGGGSSTHVNGDTEEATYNFRDRIPPEPVGEVIEREDGPDVRVLSEDDVRQMSVDLPYWQGKAVALEKELERINSDKPYCLPWWRRNAEDWQATATSLKEKTARAVAEAQELRAENLQLKAMVNQQPKLVELRTENAELQDKTRAYLKTIQELMHQLGEQAKKKDETDELRAENPLADDYNELYEKWVAIRQKLARCENANQIHAQANKKSTERVAELSVELEECRSEGKSLDENLSAAIKERQAVEAELVRYRSLSDALSGEGWFYDHDRYDEEEGR